MIMMYFDERNMNIQGVIKKQERKYQGVRNLLVAESTKL